jgi:hypothetical protein
MDREPACPLQREMLRLERLDPERVDWRERASARVSIGFFGQTMILQAVPDTSGTTT